MNYKYFRKNISNAFAITGNLIDAARYMVLNYGDFFYGKSNEKQIKINYKLPDIGSVSLLHRFNKGADRYIFSEVFIGRGYDIPLTQSPKSIRDLVANVGYASIFFKKKYPDAEVVCVEPMSHNVMVLRKNLQLNHMDVSVLEGAVSVADQPVFMQTGTKDYDFSISNDGASNNIEVKGYTVDNIMKMFGWKTIDLIKVDIEGYEKQLFSENCNWLLYVNNIILEGHFPFFTENDVKIIVDNYGFSHYEIINGL